MPIDPYLASFLIGTGGLATMGFVGGARHGHSAAHSAGHIGHAVRGHGGTSARGGPRTHGNARGGRADRWLALMSPRLLFSVAMGVGAAGLMVRPWLGGPLLLAVSLAGGVALEAFIIRPLWNLLFRFAGTPALMIESALYDTATVVSAFDQTGCGLVSLTLDGQVRQVLAQLQPADLAGPRLRSGDTVRVEAIDPGGQRLTVSRYPG